MVKKNIPAHSPPPIHLETLLLENQALIDKCFEDLGRGQRDQGKAQVENILEVAGIDLSKSDVICRFRSSPPLNVCYFDVPDNSLKHEKLKAAQFDLSLKHSRDTEKTKTLLGTALRAYTAVMHTACRWRSNAARSERCLMLGSQLASALYQQLSHMALQGRYIDAKGNPLLDDPVAVTTIKTEALICDDNTRMNDIPVPLRQCFLQEYLKDGEHFAFLFDDTTKSLTAEECPKTLNAGAVLFKKSNLEIVFDAMQENICNACLATQPTLGENAWHYIKSRFAEGMRKAYHPNRMHP